MVRKRRKKNPPGIHPSVKVGSLGKERVEYMFSVEVGKKAAFCSPMAMGSRKAGFKLLGG